MEILLVYNGLRNQGSVNTRNWFPLQIKTLTPTMPVRQGEIDWGTAESGDPKGLPSCGHASTRSNNIWMCQASS